MKTRFYLDGKRITKIKLQALIGKDRLSKHLHEAKETFKEDPYIENSWFVGYGMLKISFE